MENTEVQKKLLIEVLSFLMQNQLIHQIEAVTVQAILNEANSENIFTNLTNLTDRALIFSDIEIEKLNYQTENNIGISFTEFATNPKRVFEKVKQQLQIVHFHDYLILKQNITSQLFPDLEVNQINNFVLDFEKKMGLNKSLSTFQQKELNRMKEFEDALLEFQGLWLRDPKQKWWVGARKKVAENAYLSNNFKGFKLLFKDSLQEIKGWSIEVRKELNTYILKRTGKALEYYLFDVVKEIKRIRSNNSIKNDDEYLLIEERVSEISINKRFKNELDTLNVLLRDYIQTKNKK